MSDKIKRMHQRYLDKLISTLKANKPEEMTWKEFGTSLDFPFIRSKMSQWSKGFSLDCGTYARLMNHFEPDSVSDMKTEVLAIVSKLRRSWTYDDISVLTGIQNMRKRTLEYSKPNRSMTVMTYCKIKAVEE
jgi:hypothetical protein